MAAVLRVPFARITGLDAVRRRGFTVAALTPRDPSEPLDDAAERLRGSRVALVIGAEGSGLTDDTEAAADVRIRIPMAGGVDSLNLSVAAGIALYTLRPSRS